MKTSKKRIFIAVNLPIKIKDKIKSHYLDLLITKFKNEINFCKKNNLHITIKFLGYLSDNRVQKLKEILEKNIKNIKKFHLRVKGFSSFPEKGSPRVLWVNTYDKNQCLKNFVNILEERLIENGFREESYPKFISHITLGRIKKPLNKTKSKELNNIIILLKTRNIGTFKVNSIDIMESKLSRRGPDYRTNTKISI